MARNTCFVVIAYDITDNRRRLRVMDTLTDHGCVRVNYSVFEGLLPKSGLVKIRATINRIIDGKEDNVRFYILCEGCIESIENHGIDVASCVERQRDIII